MAGELQFFFLFSNATQIPIITTANTPTNAKSAAAGITAPWPTSSHLAVSR